VFPVIRPSFLFSHFYSAIFIQPSLFSYFYSVIFIQSWHFFAPKKPHPRQNSMAPETLSLCPYLLWIGGQIAKDIPTPFLFSHFAFKSKLQMALLHS